MNKTEIKNWLDKIGIIKYTINDDLNGDVDDDVWLCYESLTKIPIQFNKINGYFNCSMNELTSLKGCPKIVNGYFDCSYNQLTSLKGCPKIVNGHFNCYNNDLTSLKYLPDIIKGDLECDDNLKDTVEYKAFILLKALQK